MAAARACSRAAASCVLAEKATALVRRSASWLRRLASARARRSCAARRGRLSAGAHLGGTCARRLCAAGVVPARRELVRALRPIARLVSCQGALDAAHVWLDLNL